MNIFSRLWNWLIGCDCTACKSPCANEATRTPMVDPIRITPAQGIKIVGGTPTIKIIAAKSLSDTIQAYETIKKARSEFYLPLHKKRKLHKARYTSPRYKDAKLFLSTCTFYDPNATVERKKLMQAYVYWCKSMGIDPLPTCCWCRMIQRSKIWNFEKRKGSGVSTSYFGGIGLNPKAECEMTVAGAFD